MTLIHERDLAIPNMKFKSWLYSTTETNRHTHTTEHITSCLCHFIQLLS